MKILHMLMESAIMDSVGEQSGHKSNMKLKTMEL